MMNQEIKAQWVAALRSGEYEQGKGSLNKEGKFCCLGVLCDLHQKAHPEYEWEKRKHTESLYYLWDEMGMSKPIINWAGVTNQDQVHIDGVVGTLIDHNDGTYMPQKTFIQIADAIESQL